MSNDLKSEKAARYPGTNSHALIHAIVELLRVSAAPRYDEEIDQVVVECGICMRWNEHAADCPTHRLHQLLHAQIDAKTEGITAGDVVLVDAHHPKAGGLLLVVAQVTDDGILALHRAMGQSFHLEFDQVTRVGRIENDPVIVPSPPDSKVN